VWQPGTDEDQDQTVYQDETEQEKEKEKEPGCCRTTVKESMAYMMSDRTTVSMTMTRYKKQWRFICAIEQAWVCLQVHYTNTQCPVSRCLRYMLAMWGCAGEKLV
jgi:hypothetical protein